MTLSALYHDAIIAAAHRDAGHGRLQSADGSVTIDNPLCGDRVTLDIILGAPGRVAHIGHIVRGCLLCRAAAVLLAEEIPAQGVESLLRARSDIDAALEDGVPFPWPALEMFAPVRGMKSRRRCVTLPFEALVAAFTACLEGRR